MGDVVQRVEKHTIRPSHPYFGLLRSFCQKSKNLYNHANYIVRQSFTESQRWVRYGELDKQLKRDTAFPDYREMPTAQSAQQCLRILDKNWVSFFKSIKDWSRHKEKYLGRPKMPKYLKKDGSFVLVLTNQNCKLGAGVIRFPKIFRGFSVKTRINEKPGFRTIQQVRIIPRHSVLHLEVVYTVSIPDTYLDRTRVIGIDIGVNNLATVANNCGLPAFAINGRPVKSMNQFYNKRKAYLQQILETANHRHTSKRIIRLSERRNRKVSDYLHKASRSIVKFCVSNNIGTIVIGQNKFWKQQCHLGRKTNQNFVQIPFAHLIQMIQYKAKDSGIATIVTEESYTSGTSFIDGELPAKAYYDKSRRKHRGMFFSNSGLKINADLNGAYQIIRKVIPIKWDRGCALHPSIASLGI